MRAPTVATVKWCKYKGKCPWCDGKHVLLMCRKVKNTADSKVDDVNKKTEDLTLNCSNVSKKLGLKAMSQQTMVHLLFGGESTELRAHQQYQITISRLNKKYEHIVNVFHEKSICCDFPTVTLGDWLQSIERKGICLTDINGSGCETMSMLIGGPSAIETKLGWTLMGRSGKTKTCRKDTALTVISMFNRESRVSDLWELDVLGITDPTATLNKEERLIEIKKRFVDTIKINDEGRYEVLNYWRRLGIIETAPLNKADGYFLPHRHVIKDNSTMPLRPVFDALASSGNGPSLNQCLETGPNLIQLIPSVLLRLRENEIGVVADIEKAFLQISIAPDDREVLRFLWWDENKADLMRVLRHCRVVFGINSSPFMLAAIIEYHLDSALKSHCSPVPTREDALRFQKHTVEIMDQAGFRLRGWDFTGQLKVLDQPYTKKKIFSAAHRVFDPMGWACPSMLQPKLLLQELWECDLHWDSPVPADISEKFERCKVAYAATIFSRVQTKEDVAVHLVQTKSRVTPTKEKITIPRMELLATVLGARLTRMVLQSLEFEPVLVTYWSDSKVVLA
ncbi:uncharacterized protein LOC106636756 [Copidosoma floridanum]|uniref:uncharacterized protein LOC106636756 n=1 Tax=Copidosoma floridanum TaxID=29053 RepID=UPI0006C9DC2C|nr:uncharacterized protein LOC106636756 [Copidosoma floridanum]